jgi:hypothetical protein
MIVALFVLTQEKVQNRLLRHFLINFSSVISKSNFYGLRINFKNPTKYMVTRKDKILGKKLRKILKK